MVSVFPGGSVVKNLPANSGDAGLLPGSGRSPGEGNGCPPPVVLPGEFYGQRSLAGYSPWGSHTQSETTELTHAIEQLTET